MHFLHGDVDDCALARAGGAGRDGHELAEERALRAPHLALSHRRSGTCCAFVPGSAPLPWQRSHGSSSLQRDRLLHAGRDLLERELHGELDVAARALCPAGVRRAAPNRSPESAEAAEVAHEDAERFGEIDVVEPAAAAAAQPGFTVAIVRGALVADRAARRTPR